MYIFSNNVAGEASAYGPLELPDGVMEFGQGNGLLLDGIKPLPKLMFYHQSSGSHLWW